MIEVQDLVVRFGEFTAVDGLSFTVPSGCLYGLLGPNGAGKTTTISCIGGLRKPTGGSVRVGGHDVASDPMAVKRQLGIVPQKLALYGELSVRENLRIFAGLFGISGKKMADRVAFGMDLAQLSGKAEARVVTLSGGMQRRLNLACSLLHAPQVIICDEPTTGVDPQSRNHLFETIKSLHSQGRTIIYTTHYMEEVEALAERVGIVDSGRIIAEDTLDNLLATSGDGRRFTVEYDAPQSVASVGAQLSGAQVKAQRRSLEDVFLGLTGRELRESA